MLDQKSLLKKKANLSEKQIIWTYLKRFKVINNEKPYLIISAVGKLE